MRELIQNNQLSMLRQTLSDMNQVDIAEAMHELDREGLLIAFRIMPKDLSASVFSYLDSDRQQEIVEAIADHEIQALVDALFLDDTVDFLEEVPANIVTRVLKNTDEKTRQLINHFLLYPENSAGSIMTIEFVALKEDTTVAQAIESIRRTGLDKETVYTCYVTDSNRQLIGAVALHRLLCSPSDTRVGDIVEDVPILVRTQDDQESVAVAARKYDMLAVPVVDNEMRLVGIITVDDLMDVIEEENTEDFEKMAALTPSDDGYLKTGIFRMYGNRILWLMILMISGTISGFIMRRFEDVLQSAVVLASFIPMLMDTGGNCGSQASTLVIRGLALGEISSRDALRILWKELRVALLCGITLAAANFLRIILMMPDIPLPVNLAVNVTLILGVVAAKLIGGTLPILAKCLKLDPAIMAGPVITTIVDAFSLVVLFLVSTKLIHIV